jgi:hypothetical protein
MDIAMNLTHEGMLPVTGATPPKAARWYYRCGDCLTPVALEGPKPPGSVDCVCGGNLTLMGRVVRSRVVADATRCPCDGRCTGAVGPACDCECGAANHGSGRVERYTIDQGKATLVAREPGVMIERAAAFRAAVADVQAAIAANATLAGAFADRHVGRHVGHALWTTTEEIRLALSAARRLKVHGTRIKRLEKLAAEIRGGAY